jgi:hypothetical protein
MCTQPNPANDEEMMLDVLMKPCQTRHRFTTPDRTPQDIRRSSMSARILSTIHRQYKRTASDDLRHPCTRPRTSTTTGGTSTSQFPRMPRPQDSPGRGRHAETRPVSLPWNPRNVDRGAGRQCPRSPGRVPADATSDIDSRSPSSRNGRICDNLTELRREPPECLNIGPPAHARSSRLCHHIPLKRKPNPWRVPSGSDRMSCRSTVPTPWLGSSTASPKSWRRPRPVATRLALVVLQPQEEWRHVSFKDASRHSAAHVLCHYQISRRQP